MRERTPRYRAEIALALARELLRVLALPFHIAWYLPRQGTWRRRFAAAQLRSCTHPAAPSLPPPEELAELGGHICISAREASGDHHAGALAAHLRACAPRLRLTAFGGPALRAAGVELRADVLGGAAMGLRGVLRALPAILAEVAACLRFLDSERPDLLVLVDAPAFHLVLARLAHRRGIPVYYFICPQVWGWFPWRVARLRRAVTRAAAIFPFEPAWFAEQGVAADYIGHPEVEHWLELCAERSPATADLEGPGPLLAILPGSRRSDLRAHLPALVRIARRLRSEIPSARFAIAQSDGRLREYLAQQLGELEAGDLLQIAPAPFAEILLRADLALVKSGTGSLDAALAGVPMVVLYHLPSRLAEWARRNLLAVPFFSQVNLILGQVVPEICISRPEHEERIAHEALHLLADETRRSAMREDLARLRDQLQPGASKRAAALVLEMLLPSAPPGSDRARSSGG